MKLREIRKAKGLTQKELAEIVGVDTSSISKYEKGVAEPSYVVLKKLANALGVSIDRFSDVELQLGDTVQDIVDSMRTNEELRILFDLVKDSNKEDITRLIAIHMAMKDTNPNFR